MHPYIWILLTLKPAAFAGNFVRYRKLFAATGAAASQYGSALFGAHALHKAVASGAFAFLGLIGSFS